MSLTNVDQSVVQRYASLPTLRKAQTAAWIYVFGFAVITFISMYNGLLLHALYSDCDPLNSGLVQHKDQLLPFLVMDTMGRYPLVTGLFVSGVFSASLSSISTSLNSIAAVILEDFVKPAYGNQLSDKAVGYILRGTVLFVGIVTTPLVFVVEKLGMILVLIVSIHSVTFGPLLGVFIIGMTMPWLGAKSTLFGALTGLVLTGWIVFQTQIDQMSGVLRYETKYLSTENCSYSIDETLRRPNVESEKEFYHFGFIYHAMIGVLITVVAANVVCLGLGRNPKEVKTELLTPVIRRFYSRESKKIPLKLVDTLDGTEKTYVAPL